MLRCPACRARRTTFAAMQAHTTLTGHKLCNCGGYHYPHRPGSPFCESNPLSALLMADRYGAGEDDLRRCAEHLIEETPSVAAKVHELLEKWKIV